MHALRSLLVCLLATLVACDCGAPPPDDGGPAGEVRINEFCADNESVNQDEAGDFDDWIELYNPADDAADLTGFGLSDDVLAPFKYVFPAGTTIAGRGFLLVFADGEPEEGGRHAAFRLERNGEEIVLTSPAGETVDQVIFGAQFTDRTEGRTPDGEGGFTLLATPTPEGPNSGPGTPPDGGPAPVNDAGPTPPPAIGVRINEVLALPAATTQDLAGADITAGWIELFNETSNPKDLRQHRLALDGTEVVIAPGVADLPPFGHLVLFATGTPQAGPDHLGFTLPESGSLELIVPTGQPLDTLVYGPAVRGVSEGIVGEEQLELSPTPRAPNEALPVDGGPQISDAGDAG